MMVLTYVLREVQQCEHKEHILLSVLQWPVAEVTVVLAVAQRELHGEGLEAGSDVGPGIRLAGLSANTQGSADTGPVDLFKELKGMQGGRGMINRGESG